MDGKTGFHDGSSMDSCEIWKVHVGDILIGWLNSQIMGLKSCSAKRLTFL